MHTQANSRAEDSRINHCSIAPPTKTHPKPEPLAAFPFICNGDDPDDALVRAAKLGDRKAFSELSERHTTAVYKRVLRLVRNREDAEDLVQDTLLKAYNHLDQFRGTSKFSTWFYRIGINSALQLLRKRRKSFERSVDRRQDDVESWETLDFPDPAPNAEQMYTMLQARYFVLCALRGLPKIYRKVVHEFHDEERSIAEVAFTLGISVAAARSRLFRARARLRSALKKSIL